MAVLFVPFSKLLDFEFFFEFDFLINPFSFVKPLFDFFGVVFGSSMERVSAKRDEK